MDEDFNMSVRRFLKEVGVTSQQAIEDAVRSAGAAAKGRPLQARVVLTIAEIGLTHVVEGTIEGPAE